MFTSEETPTKAADIRPAAAPEGVLIGAEERRRENPATLIDPVYVARSVWKSKLLITATTIAGLAIAAFVAANTPKQYVATTQILMDPRDLKVVANEITPNGLPSDATLALIESQTAVIMSNNVLGRVIDEAKLEEDPEFNGQGTTGPGALVSAALQDFLGVTPAAPVDRGYETLAQLRQALTVDREAKSFVINLSVKTRSAARSAEIANIIATVFIEEQGRVQSDTARRATTAITARLSELRKSVVTAEQAVEDYKRENALIGVGGRLVDDDYITRINTQLARARGDITALRVKAESMRNASVEDVVRGTLPEELSSEALVRLRQTYSDLSQQAAVLATKLGSRHPQRIASESALSSSRQAIASELSRIVAAAQTELARATATERDLTAQIADLKEKQVTTSGSFVKLRELEREVDASRAVYEAFLLRARETGEQESLNTANVRVISDATPPLKSAGVSRTTVVLAGGMLGFIAGIALAMLLALARLLRAVFNDRRARRRRLRTTAEAPEDVIRPVPAAMPTVATGSTSDAGPSRIDRPPAGLPAVAPEASALRPSAAPHTDVARPAEEAALRERESAAARLAFGEAAARAERQKAAARQADAEASEKDRLSDAARRARAALRATAQPSASTPPGADSPLEGDASPLRRLSREEALLQAKLDDMQVRSPPAERPMSPAADLPLASAGQRAARPGAGERVSLRDRVQALSQAKDREIEQARRRDAALAPEVASLHDEIQTVKQAIADIRRRRALRSAGPQ